MFAGKEKIALVMAIINLFLIRNLNIVWADEVDDLIQQLQDKNAGVRKSAAEALGEIGDARVIESLIKALKDTDEHVRYGAAFALGEIKDARAVEPLIETLKEDMNEWRYSWRTYYVRRGAANALGKIGKPGLESLIKVLEDPDANVRSVAKEALTNVSNLIVRRLRSAHLDERVSNEVLENMLTEKTFSNNSYLLYISYTSPDNFGDLAKMIFTRLIATAKREGKDIHSYIKGLDPQGVFYEDFILQSANFSQLDDILITPEVLTKVTEYLFKALLKEKIESYAVRLALFVEAVINDKGFQYQKGFQEELMRLYKETTGLNQHFVAAILSVYKDNLSHLDREKISEITERHNIEFRDEIFPYDKLIKTFHIVFGDKDAAEAHYGMSVDFFKGKGWSKKPSGSNNEVILEKGGFRFVFIKADEERYDINTQLKDAGGLILRIHAGEEERVFVEQAEPIDSKGKVFIISSCRSATISGKISSNYPGGYLVVTKDITYGNQTNQVTYYLIESLEKKIPTEREIRTYMRARLPYEINANYVLPGDPSTEVLRIVREYNSGISAG